MMTLNLTEKGADVLMLKIEELHVRIAELEAAAQWHGASEPPVELSIDNENTVPVVVCHGNMLEYDVDCYNTRLQRWNRYANIHCWKNIGEPPMPVKEDK